VRRTKAIDLCVNKSLPFQSTITTTGGPCGIRIGK
jgi:hypothetical protein